MPTARDFRDGDTVMLCNHIFEAACRGEQPFTRDLKIEGRFSPPLSFNRDDGTAASASFHVRCRACASVAVGNVDFVEEIHANGQLHPADIFGLFGCGRRDFKGISDKVRSAF